MVEIQAFDFYDPWLEIEMSQQTTWTDKQYYTCDCVTGINWQLCNRDQLAVSIIDLLPNQTLPLPTCGHITSYNISIGTYLM